MIFTNTEITHQKSDGTDELIKGYKPVWINWIGQTGLSQLRLIGPKGVYLQVSCI